MPRSGQTRINTPHMGEIVSAVRVFVCVCVPPPLLCSACLFSWADQVFYLQEVQADWASCEPRFPWLPSVAAPRVQLAGLCAATAVSATERDCANELNNEVSKRNAAGRHNDKTIDTDLTRLNSPYFLCGFASACRGGFPSFSFELLTAFTFGTEIPQQSV